MDGEKQEDSNSRIAAITFPSTSAAVTVATVCPCSAAGARAPSSSLSIISSDRQAVQVIQHAIQRPHNMAAQFLQQMYAAQQQHLMLQTAALQQQHQHSPHLQSLATMHQASVRQRQSTSSSSEGLTHQPAGVSIALPASPVTTQLVGRTQNSISSGVSTTISQQAMLLGGRPANCNQAQMYLRTQMLILAPAASVAAVQSDLPPVTSCSSASNSSQVQNLVLHQLPGALAAAHNVILKPPPPCPALTPAASKISICPPKSSQVTESSSERPQPEVTGSQGITPALSPAQMTLKQQLSCPPGHQGAHRHLILQQDTAASLNHRQHQSIPLSVSPHDSISNPPPFSSKIQSSPDTQSQTPRNSPASSSSLTSASSQTSIPAAKVLPQPPPLLAAPQRWSSFPQVQSRPPPPLILPRFPQNPPVTLQRLSQDVRTQVAQKEQEPPATERLVQTLYQNVPPPQTVAIDLKVQPAAHNAKPLSGQTPKGNSLSPSEKKDESPRLSPRLSRPFPGSPEHNGAVVDLSLSLSSHAQIRPPAAEEPSQIAASSSNHPPPSPPQLPHILPAAVRCPSHPPSSPRSPFEPLTTHVLTHLVEGFVIQEGLEPFPVHPSSLEKPASPSDSQEIATNQASVEEESPLAANQSISSDSEMESNGPAVDGVNNRWSREVAEHGESVGGVLRCEYCGSRGYACAFLSSKRFCSMTCGRRFSKHIKLLRTGRWGHRATGRRERPPSRVNGVSREHFLKRIYRSGKARKDQEQEDEAPAPMTTRLRKQAERRREKQREKETEEREPEGQITETISISDEGEEDRRPSHWGVEQVFSYINSLPGGEDVAEVFRSQEIDGQALLLLTEDHLVSTMNLKLGPALKLHAYINSLKEA